MSLAPQALENTASKYAAEAIRLDSQGSRGMAVQSYQHAIEALVKLVQIYPEYKLNKVYMERASAYQNRIKALQMSRSIDEVGSIVNESSKNCQVMGGDSKASERPGNSRQEDNDGVLKNYIEELVMKEKPDVSWDEVI